MEPKPMTLEDMDPIETARTIERLESDILKWFGYVEKWREYPIRDHSQYWWERPSSDQVLYSDSPEALKEEDESLTYSAVIRESCERDGIRLFEMDTQCDGNVYLAIFDGKKYVERN